MAETLSFRRRHLPHWIVADRPLFVTIRLKGSLPKAVVEQVRREREDLLANNADVIQRQEFEQRAFEKIEAI
ncbi:hypothetical protein HQ590_06840, partial [bacterium]|nr:hypothetical protein [bacterium]